MLSNFKKKQQSESQSDPLNHSQQQWGIAMTEKICPCRSESEDALARSHACRSLPSFRSVMEVLYPPSYLGAPSPSPDPPSYKRITYSVQESSIDSAPISDQSHPDPLSQDPSLSGVPSQGTSSFRALLVEPSPPGFKDIDIPEEPLPAYTRLDQCRPRFPNASDILGPYPPMSIIRRSAR